MPEKILSLKSVVQIQLILKWIARDEVAITTLI